MMQNAPIIQFYFLLLSDLGINLLTAKISTSTMYVDLQTNLIHEYGSAWRTC